jgi:hypothetical protein
MDICAPPEISEQHFPDICIPPDTYCIHFSGVHLQTKHLQTFAHLPTHLYGFVFISPEHMSRAMVSGHIHTSGDIYMGLYILPDIFTPLLISIFRRTLTKTYTYYLQRHLYNISFLQSTSPESWTYAHL